MEGLQHFRSRRHFIILYLVVYYSIVFVHLIFLTFVSCPLTVTLHIVDVRLTCLINITYLLTLKSEAKPAAADAAYLRTV